MPVPAPRVRAETYADEAGRIIGAALVDDTAYRRLAFLGDRIGHRLSGSVQLERAIEWAVAEMKKDKLDNVRAEKVMVPHWVRGAESLELVEPASTTRNLPMLGLGNSVGTPPEGLTAEAVVVRNFDELDALGEKVRGKIVVYNAPYTTYGATVQYRGGGASRAARYGALAALVRSVGPVSLQTPHTGALRYDEATAENSRRRHHHRSRRDVAADAGARRDDSSPSEDGGEVFAGRRVRERHGGVEGSG